MTTLLLILYVIPVCIAIIGPVIGALSEMGDINFWDWTYPFIPVLNIWHTYMVLMGIYDGVQGLRAKKG